jgi:hypothetical protein
MFHLTLTPAKTEMLTIVTQGCIKLGLSNAGLGWDRFFG